MQRLQVHLNEIAIDTRETRYNDTFAKRQNKNKKGTIDFKSLQQ